MPRESKAARLATTAAVKKRSRSYSTSTLRKLPPYGRRLAANLGQGWKPDYGGTIFIAAGLYAWDLAKRWDNAPQGRAFLCILPDESPASYDWSLLQSSSAIVYDTGDFALKHADQLASILLRARADLAYLIVCDNAWRGVSYRAGQIATVTA